MSFQTLLYFYYSLCKHFNQAFSTKAPYHVLLHPDELTEQQTVLDHITRPHYASPNSKQLPFQSVIRSFLSPTSSQIKNEDMINRIGVACQLARRILNMIRSVTKVCLIEYSEKLRSSL